MMKFLNWQKIFLMGASLSLVACNQFPEFPRWNPVAIIPSQNKKFACKIVDKESLTFSCEGLSSAIGNTLDGYFCSSPSETVDVINWAREVKRKYKENGP